MTSKREDKEFDPHPEGTFMAVCRDIWIERKPNPKVGQKNQWGNDEPEELVRVVFEFLTDEPIEVNGEMHPRFISAKLNHTWAEKGKLRAFVSAWDPALGRSEDADLETLVGRGAYLTITHKVGNDGTVWANITNVAAPPKGATVPGVPSEFTRRRYR